MRYLQKTIIKTLVFVMVFTYAFPIVSVSESFNIDYVYAGFSAGDYGEGKADKGSHSSTGGRGIGGNGPGGGGYYDEGEQAAIDNISSGRYNPQTGEWSGGNDGGGETQREQVAKAAAKKAAEDKAFFSKINKAIEEVKEYRKELFRNLRAFEEEDARRNKSFLEKAVDFAVPSTSFGWARAAFGFVVGYTNEIVGLAVTAINAGITVVEKGYVDISSKTTTNQNEVTTGVVSGTQEDDGSNVLGGSDGDTLVGDTKVDTLAPQDVNLGYEGLTDEEKERGTFYTIEEFQKLDLNKIFNIVVPPAVDRPAGPTPILDFNAFEAIYGQTYTTLSWSSRNTTQCSGTNFDTFDKTSGSVDASPNTTTTYYVTCTGFGGSITKGVTVEVIELPLPPTPPSLFFYATTTAGDSSVLSWESVDATICNGVNFNTRGETSGSVEVSQGTTTTYSIVCTGEGGSVSEEVIVKVYSPETSIEVVSLGGGTVITWATTDVENCLVSGTDGYSYQVPAESVASGSVEAGFTNQGVTYTISCDILDGS